MILDIITADYGNTAQADAVVGLTDAYAADPMGGGKRLTAEVRGRLIASLSGRSGAFSLLALADGAFIGVANCFEGFSTFAAQPLVNIHDVFVLAGWRGRGVAGLLLRAAENVARARGCCAVTLEVLQRNKPAQAAYLRAGFSGSAGAGGLDSTLFWKKPLPVSA